MVGPVLYLEMLLGGRRGQQLVFRYIYVGWIVLQLAVLYFIYLNEYYARNRWGLMFGYEPPDPSLTSRFATGYVEMFVIQQMIIILLATPAFTAGAITDEKTRGTLQYLLTANLTSAEIVIGKLLGRAAQVGLFILGGLPALCFIGVWGGLQPGMMVAVFGVTVAPVLALGSASLLASVWCRQTRDAVLSLYIAGVGLFLLALGSRSLDAWLSPAVPPGESPGFLLSCLRLVNAVSDYFNPLFVLAPGWEATDLPAVGRRLAISILCWGSLAGGCLGLAIWRLRGGYLRQLENAGKKQPFEKKAIRRPPVDEEPIRWKERMVDGIAPLDGLKGIPASVGLVLVFLATFATALALLWLSMPAGVTLGQALRTLGGFQLARFGSLVDGDLASPRFLTLGIGAMLIASLVVGIRCSGTISGERERQTWEALLLTPLEVKQLVRAKLWGILGASLPFLLAYAIPALVLSVLGGFLSLVWILLWLAVTLLAMYYIGAAGMWCSVRSRSSWRSLLGTLGWGYVGGFVLYGITQPVIWIVAGILFIFLKILDQVYQLGLTRAIGAFGDFFVAFFVASCLVLAGIFYGLAWWFVADAEKRVSERERIRHWKDEMLFRPRRRVEMPGARYYR